MKRIVMLALTLPVFLVGCGAPSENLDSEVRGETSQSDTNSNYREIENGSYDVKLFTTTLDGAKCRVAVVYEAVSMDCDETVTTESEFE